MSRFIRSLSSTALGSRPSQPSAASSLPNHSPRIETSSASQRAPKPLPGPTLAEEQPPTMTSIRAQWTLGLTQHNDFELHAALRTFKRLVRALRVPTEGNSSPIIKDIDLPPPAPYQILLPTEVALLFINIGLIQAYLGQYYPAGEAFEEALLLDQTSGVAWFGLGIAKFHSQELSASKRAFKRCKKCFTTTTTQTIDGDNISQEEKELVYNIWPGPLNPPAPSAATNTHDAENSEINLDQFKGIMNHRLPNNQWKLECERAEWNYRIAKEKHNFLRYGKQEPGIWTMTGIPAGVIFDLDANHPSSSSSTRTSHILNTEVHQEDDENNEIGVHDSNFRDEFFADDASTTTTFTHANADNDGDDHSTKNSNNDGLKRTWTGLQERFLANREPSTKRSRFMRLRGGSSPSSSSSSQSLPSTLDQQEPAIDIGGSGGNSTRDIIPVPAQPDVVCNRVFIDDEPAWPFPFSSTHAPSPSHLESEDESFEGEDMDTDDVVNDGHEANTGNTAQNAAPVFSIRHSVDSESSAFSIRHSYMAENALPSPVFPIRQSSLVPPPTPGKHKPSEYRRRARLEIGTAVHAGGIGIEEDLARAGDEPISQDHPLRPRDSGSISPCDISQGIYNESLPPPPSHHLEEDFRNFGAKEKDTRKRSTASNDDHMRGSFSTDAISSLSSSIAFFAPLSGEQSRAGSRAGNHSPSPLARGDGEEEERSWGAEEVVGRRYLERVEEDRDESEEREGMDGYGDEEDVKGEYREEHDPTIIIMPATPSDRGHDAIQEDVDPYFLPGLFDWPSAPEPPSTEQNNVDQNPGHSSMEAMDEYESLREMVTEPQENTSHSPQNPQPLPRPFTDIDEEYEESVFSNDSSPSSPSSTWSPPLHNDQNQDRGVHLVNLRSIPEIPFTSSRTHLALRNMASTNANLGATVQAFYYDYSLPITIHMPSPPANTAYNPTTLQWENNSDPMSEVENDTWPQLHSRTGSQDEDEDEDDLAAAHVTDWLGYPHPPMAISMDMREDMRRFGRYTSGEREGEREGDVVDVVVGAEREGEGYGEYDGGSEEQYNEVYDAYEIYAQDAGVEDEDEDEDGYTYGDEYTNAGNEDHDDEDSRADYDNADADKGNANEDEENDHEHDDMKYDNDGNDHDDNTSKEAILSPIANSKT
ncbi:MAG: hypothetical protein Q9169_005686 [Polycauliona sp. 2 TL-2023]